jgi:cobalt/nickel transport system permease protein
MGSTMISPHIPDLDLITSYAEHGDSFFSKVSPWTKLAALVCVILLVTLTRSLVVCTGLFLAVFLTYRSAGLPVKKLFAWYLLPLIFVLSLVGIMAWSEPGTALVSFSVAGIAISLSDNGAILVITLLLKALISVTFSLFFLMTTRYQHFSGMISRLFPSPLDQIFLLAYRFLFLTLAMTGTMIKAVRSRGGGIIRSVWVQGRLFAEIFALVFIRSFERAERVDKAMHARGYHGFYVAGSEIPRPGWYGYGVICACVIAIAVVTLRVPGTGGG